MKRCDRLFEFAIANTLVAQDKKITWAQNYNASLKLSRPYIKAGNILKLKFSVLLYR